MATLLFQGVSALVGGLGLVADPSGRTVGLPIAWLAGSIFADYQAPGLVLFAALGVVPLVVAYRLWHRRPGAWLAAAGIGMALLVWIAVQIHVIGYRSDPPLQLIYGGLGLGILGLSLLPAVRGHAAPRLEPDD